MAEINLPVRFICSMPCLRASAQNCQTYQVTSFMHSSSRSFVMGGNPNPLQFRSMSSSMTEPASPICKKSTLCPFLMSPKPDRTAISVLSGSLVPVVMTIRIFCCCGAALLDAERHASDILVAGLFREVVRTLLL